MKKNKPPRASAPARIELDARQTIVHAADLHRTLLERLASGRPLIVDGTRVEEIDTAILQLLVSLWRSARERGTACVWQGASESLRRAAGLIGVAEMLQFPDAMPAIGSHAAG